MHEHPVETAGSACLARRAEWLESQRGIRLVTGVSQGPRRAAVLTATRDGSIGVVPKSRDEQSLPDLDFSFCDAL